MSVVGPSVDASVGSTGSDGSVGGAGSADGFDPPLAGCGGATSWAASPDMTRTKIM